MSHSVLPCDGCGCHCRNCNDHAAGLHLHVEIENLKQRLLEKENYILSMETNFLREAEKFPNGEVAAISEELSTWQDKYSRLYEAHKRVQKVNQNLEDKLLRTVDKCETEKNALTNEVANLTRRLVDEKYNVARLQEENERYRNDVNLAIQLLQCKPSNFVSQKYDSLPGEMQQKVRNYISNKRRPSDGNGNVQGRPEMKTIKVPIPTYPPTAMVYSVNKGPLEKELDAEEKPSQPPVDIVSAAIMAKVLEEREKERAQTRHCETCTCPVVKCSKSVQTLSECSSEKCSPVSQVNKIGFNAMSVRNRLNDKEKEKPLDYRPSHRLSKSDTSTKVTHIANNNWEVDIDRLAVSRVIKPDKKTKNETVAEGILVNLDSTENSSVNSVTSDSSSISWPSKVGSAQNSEKHDSSETDLISFDKPVLSKTANDESKVIGPRHCSVRMQLGSNNILLDNIVDPFTPILYKSRNSDPLVHTSRSRSGSSNSSTEEHAPTNSKIIFRTETEI